MTDLPKRELGRTGLQVTMLGYGAMELRGAPRGRDVTEAQAETILHGVLDAGINYIDTSIDYGLSEERIGRYIASRRSEYYLASKCGCAVGATPAPRGQRNPHVFTRDNIVAGVEQSLARMKTDHLDVVQFHASPSRQILEEHDASRRCCRSSGRARCGSSACLLRCRTSRITSRWVCSMCSRYRTRPWSVSTRRSSPWRPARERASSLGAGLPKVRQPAEGKRPCNGSAGRRHDSMTCSGA